MFKLKQIVVLAVTVALALLVAGCSSVDPTTSEEYQALESQLAAAQQQLADVIVERDALAAEALTAAARHDKVLANQEAVAEIIANPYSFGTEDEVLDLLMTYAAPGAVVDDVAFGPVDMRSSWKYTVFELAADIEKWAIWTAEDGSMGGVLWVWSGTARNGKPFELIGINTDLFDDDGLVTHSLVQWPYKNDYVTGAINNGN
jgi:outer membrane murein-binding lipoprotein Lpp